MNLALPLIAVQSISTLSLSHGFLITAPARPSASVPAYRQVELKINKALFSAALTLPETLPLAPHTFGGMVELGIIERFGEEAANRVLQSWRLLEMGYEHKEFVGEGEPETSACHQHAHSYVPGLNAQPFYPVDDQPLFRLISFTRSRSTYRNTLQKHSYKITSRKYLPSTGDISRRRIRCRFRKIPSCISSSGEPSLALVIRRFGNGNPARVRPLRTGSWMEPRRLSKYE